MKKWNAIALPHTSATDQGTDWAEHSDELEPVVEIYQGHRLVYEHEGGPHAATPSRKYLYRSGYQAAGFVWNALAKGYRMGFEASSDHCSTHISYACIIAESNTREAIIRRHPAAPHVRSHGQHRDGFPRNYWRPRISAGR